MNSLGQIRDIYWTWIVSLVADFVTEFGLLKGDNKISTNLVTSTLSYNNNNYYYF